MKTEKLTVKKYAALRNVTPEGVRIALKRETKLPGLKKAEKFGRDWVLTVDVSELKK